MSARGYQVIVVRIFGFKRKCPGATPRQTSEPRRRARVGATARLTTPDAGTCSQAQQVRVDLAYVRRPRQGTVSKTRQCGWDDQMQLVSQRSPKLLQKPGYVVRIDTPTLCLRNHVGRVTAIAPRVRRAPGSRCASPGAAAKSGRYPFAISRSPSCQIFKDR
jgi:hypothetical protein